MEMIDQVMNKLPITFNVETCFVKQMIEELLDHGLIR